jgi:hypothetical protein
MKKTATVEVRIAPADLARLRSAAELAAVPVSEIVRRGAAREAKRILSGSALPSYLMLGAESEPK